MFHGRLQEAAAAHVTAVVRKQTKKARPQPLNTVEMLKQASKVFQTPRPPPALPTLPLSLGPGLTHTPPRGGPTLSPLVSQVLGIGPHAAMQAAERLYLMGYLSYPRTESTAYPKSFDFRAVVEEHCHSPSWGAYAAALLDKGLLTRPRDGLDAGDHPPITPVSLASQQDLHGDQWKL